MSQPVLFVVGTLTTWCGYAVSLRAVYLAIVLLRPPVADAGRTTRGLLAACLFAAFALLTGNRLAPAPGLHIPLVWLVMPFSAWAAMACLATAVARMVQAVSGLRSEERSGRLRSAAAWLAACVGFVVWFRLDADSSVQIVQGSIPIGPPTAIGLGLLAVGTVTAMVLTERAVRGRGVAKLIVTHSILIVGSLLFGLPLFWLVITSFKEDIDMSSPNGIVWVPRVQVMVPYRNPARPLYEGALNGTEIQGEVMERRSDGTVKLDINRPMSMRGMTVDAPLSTLREIPRQVPIVDVTMDGRLVRGRVVDELEDGRKRVEVVSPASLAGKQQTYQPGDVIPVRTIGLRTRNYPDALDFLPPEADRGLTYLKNTLIIVVLGMAGTILSSALVAYAFSRMRFPGRDVLFALLLSTMMLPGAVTKLPTFLIFKQLGWIDTLYPMWVPAFFGSAFNIFMLRQFFKQIPLELEDAAKIDGANHLRIFWSVMMPLIKPALAVIAILTFVGTWNNFLDPLIYITSPEKMTISYAVQLYASDRSGEPGLVTAFTTLSMLPVLALFFFTQRYFIEGTQLTGLGGR